MTSTRGSGKKSRAPYLVALLLVIVGGCFALIYGISYWAEEQRAIKMPNPVPATEENLKAGLKVYNDHCVQCHGDKGDGKGQKSAQLSVEPGNFTDTRKMFSVTDGELYWQISKGRNPMPGYEDKLTPRQRWQAVDYLRAFAPQQPAGALRQQPAPTKGSQ